MELFRQLQTLLEQQKAQFEQKLMQSMQVKQAPAQEPMQVEQPDTFDNQMDDLFGFSNDLFVAPDELFCNMHLVFPPEY